MRLNRLPFLILVSLLMWAGIIQLVLAAPTLTADAMPATGPQPSTAAITVNGSAGPACTLPKAADGSVMATCDLAALAVPGVYTIVMTYTYTAGCVNTANAATCTQGGVASSAPFVLTRSAPPAAGPVLRISP
jgi:hypothetical protein